MALVPFGLSAQAPIEFRSAFDDSPLDVRPKPGETLTDAVKTFHATGRNSYAGDAKALAEGKQLYLSWCQGCHLPDGTGRIGPSLVGDSFTYDRVSSDIGMFEVIYGGAAGAMQAFSKRINQDQMLKIIAYVRSLKEERLTGAVPSHAIQIESD